MGKDKEYFGHAIVNGVPQFYSVSSLERGDIRSGGCVLKWHKRYVQGIKDVESKSLAEGNKLHSELEHFLKNPGAPVMLSATAMRALPYIPDPGPDLLVENYLSSPRDPHLWADGVPLIVKIDLLHDRGTNKGCDDVEDAIDPPGTVEVLDWKWKKDGSKTEFMLQPAELHKSIQMSGYACTVNNRWKDRERIRLSHVYIPAARGVPRKVTRLHVIDDCRRTWEYVDSVARTLRHVASETDERKVPGNRHACDKFGGCQHRDTCYAYNRHVEQYTSAKLFGETAASELREDMALTINVPGGAAAFAPGSFLAQAGVAQQQPQPDMKAQLAAEEAALRAQAAQTAAAIDPKFIEAMQIIARVGLAAGGPGSPTLAGQAAQWKAAMDGYQIQPGAGLAGAGQLAGLTISDPLHVIQLASELAALQPVGAVAQQVQQVLPPVQHVQHNTAAPMSILPPEAPQSNPALAARAVEGFQLPMQMNTTTQTPAPTQIAATVTLQPGAPVVVAEAPKKRGRKSNAEKAAAAAQSDQSVVNSHEAMLDSNRPAAPQTTSTDEAFDADSAVYVNCIPNGDFESLHPYIDSVCMALDKKFNTAPDALHDIRTAPKDGPLGFGGWKGAIRAIVTDCPPPAGNWFVDARGDELAAEVANALRGVCERVGAQYTKGI